MKQSIKMIADYPFLVEEFHQEKNGEKTAFDVLAGSSKKVWWKCQNGHEWEAQPRFRVDKTAPNHRAQGCPYCMKKFSSLESLVYTSLQTVTDCLWRSKFDGRTEIDVLLTREKIAIEVDGFHWHKDKEMQDKKKNETLRNAGYSVVRLREKPLVELGENDVLFHATEDQQKVVTRLIESLGMPVLSVNWEEAISESCRHKSSTVKEGTQLSVRFPEIAKEWDVIKNCSFPDSVSYGSKKKVWWKCGENHSWLASITNRTCSKSSCPFCEGRKATEKRNLAFIHPHLMCEWNESSIDPKKVTPSSNIVVNWKCQRCGKEYDASVSERVRGRGCTHCRYERMAETRRRTNALQNA